MCSHAHVYRCGFGGYESHDGDLGAGPQAQPFSAVNSLFLDYPAGFLRSDGAVPAEWEIELDEDEEIEEVEELEDDIEEIEEDEDVEDIELDEDEELEEVDELDQNVEEIELDDDQEIEDVLDDEDIDEVELGEDEELDEIEVVAKEISRNRLHGKIGNGGNKISCKTSNGAIIFSKLR